MKGADELWIDSHKCKSFHGVLDLRSPYVFNPARNLLPHECAAGVLRDYIGAKFIGSGYGKVSGPFDNGFKASLGKTPSVEVGSSDDLALDLFRFAMRAKLFAENEGYDCNELEITVRKIPCIAPKFKTFNTSTVEFGKHFLRPELLHEKVRTMEEWLRNSFPWGVNVDVAEMPGDSTLAQMLTWTTFFNHGITKLSLRSVLNKRIQKVIEENYD